jgi:hypothetical protein
MVGDFLIYFDGMAPMDWWKHKQSTLLRIELPVMHRMEWKMERLERRHCGEKSIYFEWKYGSVDPDGIVTVVEVRNCRFLGKVDRFPVENVLEATVFYHL